MIGLRKSNRGLVLVALMLIMSAADLGAQGLLSRARQAVSGDAAGVVVDGIRGAGAGADRSSPPTAAAGEEDADDASETGRSVDLLTMDAQVLDRLGHALSAEIGFRDEWIALDERFVACQGRMYTDPAILDEMLALSDRFATAMEAAAGSTDGIVKAGEDYQAATDAVVERECGLSQTAFTERQDRVADDAVAAGLDEGGFSDRQYAILKERIVPFCSAGGKSARIAGPDGDEFYVYEEAEVGALAPRCETILPLVERTI